MRLWDAGKGFKKRRLNSFFTWLRILACFCDVISIPARTTVLLFRKKKCENIRLDAEIVWGDHKTPNSLFFSTSAISIWPPLWERLTYRVNLERVFKTLNCFSGHMSKFRVASWLLIYLFFYSLTNLHL